MSDDPSLGSWPPDPPGGSAPPPPGSAPPPPPPGAAPAPLPPPETGPSEDEAGWAAPPPPPGAGPVPDRPGWAAPPPPGGGASAAADPSATASAAGGGHRRRNLGFVGLAAGLAITASRFFLGGQDDPSSSRDFAVPAREEGRPVTATPLTSDEVCALLTPADLRAIYERRFDAGQPLADTGPASSGEPSDVPDVGAVGACTWTTRPGETALTVSLLTVPAIGGDANRTYELLRPSSPVQGFDTSTPVGDEAFVRFDTSLSQDGYSDSMVVRAGGVVLNIEVTGDEEPEGGLDSVVEVAQAAVDDLPADP